MSQSDADRRAAAAVVDHHSQLAATLAALTGALRDAANDDLAQVWRRRDELLTWLRTELLSHAHAEETALYPAAAARPAGGPLVEGMLAEHRAITALVAELESAGTPVDAAAAARALAALFAVHLAKENDLVVPLLVEAGDVSLAALLDGMHDLIGAASAPTAGGGGCGGGHACGCGGDTGGGATADAPVLSLDARIDVRQVPHGERHARVLTALDAVPAGGALVLVAPHAPRPLLAQIDARYGGRFDTEWLQDGPDVWQIRLQRQP